ncbi:hypothetical protein D082_30050 [Synechocystis sp. PCC 6714]|nr:hypothetical protein D082_30050 [Synechocystis sp. PCC 6714]
MRAFIRQSINLLSLEQYEQQFRTWAVISPIDPELPGLNYWPR